MNKYDKTLSLFFSSRGRLGRLAFTCLFLFIIVFFTLINNIFSFDKYIEYFQTGAAYSIAKVIKKIVINITNLLSTIIVIFLIIKRLHDFNQSGLTLLFFPVIIFAGAVFKCNIAGGGGFECIFDTIIIAFLISILFLCVWPGVKKDNKYGKQPASLFDLGLNKLD